MKRMVFRIIGMGFGVVFGIILAEITCKFIDIREAQQYRRASGNISRPSRIPDVRFELIPGSTGITPGQTKIIRVNQEGFRGPEISPVKQPGSFRIAVLGDSIAFGRYLDEAEVFPYQLPELLKARHPDTEFEVINASLSGRDTWEEVALLEHKVLALDPDLVIIQVCMNDHIRFPPPDPKLKRGVFGERHWYSYSSLFAAMDRKWEAFRNARIKWGTRLGFDMRTSAQLLATYALDMRYIHDVTPNWPAWQLEFLRANELSRNHGARLLVAVFPTTRIIVSDAAETVPELSDLGRQHGFLVVDLLDAFRPHGASILNDYTHPSAQGHRVAAEFIADAIDRLFLAPAENTTEANVL